MKKYIRYLLTLRYIKLLSYQSAKHLQQSRQETHKHRYTYYYGSQIIYGAINKFLLLILLGLLFNILPQILLVSISFVMLRVFAGGLHFNSYTKCAYVSLLSFAIMGIMAKYVFLNISQSVIIFLIVFILFLIYAPVEHINRPLKNNIERIKFKIISLVLLILLFLITVNTNNVIISNSIIYGVILAGTITTSFVNKLK